MWNGKWRKNCKAHLNVPYFFPLFVNSFPLYELFFFTASFFFTSVNSFLPIFTSLPFCTQPFSLFLSLFTPLLQTYSPQHSHIFPLPCRSPPPLYASTHLTKGIIKKKKNTKQKCENKSINK